MYDSPEAKRPEAIVIQGEALARLRQLSARREQLISINADAALRECERDIGELIAVEVMKL